MCVDVHAILCLVFCVMRAHVDATLFVIRYHV